MYELLYNSYMDNKEKYQVLRIWKKTHRTLRQIAALTDESLVELLERIANEEKQRVQGRMKEK